MEITCRDREFVDLLEQRKAQANQMPRRGPLFIYSPSGGPVYGVGRSCASAWHSPIVCL